MRTRIALAALGAFVGLGGPALGDDGPNADTIETARRSVVQILADSCAGESRAGTGFAYGAPGTVISALHVVAGCARLRVFFEHAGIERPARLAQALATRDLAVIEVEDPPALPPLERAPVEPTSTQRLQAIGYGDSPTMENLEVTVSSGARRLVDLLPRQSRLEVERSTEVDVEAPIVRFNRPLLPGFSGGPIIDRDGRVAAISAGGLRSGTVPVSWGWPAHFVEELMASTAGAADVAASSPTVFFSAKRDSEAAAGEIAADDTGVRCGALTLRRQATLSLDEIARTASEQGMINWFITAAAASGQELSQVDFDLWVDPDSGATIPLPSTAAVISETDWCVARSPAGRYRLLVHGQSGLPLELDLSESNETVQASNAFDRLIDAELTRQVGPYFFQLDTALTDLLPNMRADGLVVRHQAGYAFPVSGGAPSYFYTTHMARNGSYVGVAAINDQVDVEAIQTCSYFPDSPECSAFKRTVADWTPMIFAASMATYPIQ